MTDGENEDNRERASVISSIFQNIFQTFAIVFIVRSITGYLSPKNVTSEINTINSPKVLSPFWKTSDTMEIQFLVSESENPFDKATSQLLWRIENLSLGHWDDTQRREKNVHLELSENISRKNGTLFAHAILKNLDKEENAVLLKSTPLITYSKRRKSNQKRNLLRGTEYESLQAEEFEESSEVFGHWIGNLTINVVPEVMKAPLNSIPPILRQYINLDSTKSKSYPILYLNQFWNLKKEFIPLDGKVDKVPFKIRYEPIPFWKFQLLIQFGESLKSQAGMGNDPEEMKEMLRDANPYLLGITMIASILHSIFDFLAFKNDINFWKNRENFEGLSVRSILLNVFFQIVTFLYLLDNETSYLILVSSGVGLLIEIWKVRKAMTIKLDWSKFPFMTFSDKSTYVKSKTREYDEMAMRYLSYISYPLLAMYCVYSLIYSEHKSWYSFVLSTLVGFVYTFGFIMMTPQLFINYKLKSVAHMPWKTFMYKALNTFIDDLFAFAIKMPTLHRLACLRDDVIFIIYLYQRWIYPVDKTRANEFGQKEESELTESDPKEKKE